MTLLIDHVVEKVCGRVAISDTLYQSLHVEESTRPAFREAVDYELSITWKGRVINTAETSLQDAKYHLIEKYKYAIYNDLLTNIYLLKDKLFERDIEEALAIVNKIIVEVKA